MSKYMDYVNELAVENVKNGGDPFAACIVYEDQMIAEGVNETHLKKQVSRHAELIAIEKAQALLDSNDLSKCILYASGHPCPMCLGAIGFTGIKTVYYNNSLEEAESVELGLSLDIYKFIKKEKSSFNLKLKQIEIDNNPMSFYANQKRGENK